MIHSRKGRKLGRTSSHRASTLAALATSLIRHKKIRTTVAKAKEARIYVEPLITKAKNSLSLTGADQATKLVHARRQVGRYIKDNDVLKMLFAEIAPKVANRPGGYTRVIKLGRRLGDSAEMAILELVDWNEGGGLEAKPKIAKPRPTRRKAKPAAPAETAVPAVTAEAIPEANEDVAELPPQE